MVEVLCKRVRMANIQSCWDSQGVDPARQLFHVNAMVIKRVMDIAEYYKILHVNKWTLMISNDTQSII